MANVEQRGGEIPPHGRVGARKNPLLGAAHLPYLRLFQGTCCHRVLGRGRDVPCMPLPSACPQRTPSGQAHTQQRAAAACRPLRLAFVVAAAFILAVGAGNPSGRPMPCRCTRAAISSDSRGRRGVQKSCNNRAGPAPVAWDAGWWVWGAGSSRGFASADLQLVFRIELSGVGVGVDKIMHHQKVFHAKSMILKSCFHALLFHLESHICPPK